MGLDLNIFFVQNGQADRSATATTATNKHRARHTIVVEPGLSVLRAVAVYSCNVLSSRSYLEAKVFIAQLL